MRRLALVLAITVLIGCGADSPTAPTSQIPEVAGTYTGPLTLRVVTTGDSLQGSARFDVAQAGAQLTITGSITFLGETAQLPAITGTINATGFFTPTSGGVAGAVNDPDCGRITPASASITFSGERLSRISVATSKRGSGDSPGSSGRPAGRGGEELPGRYPGESGKHLPTAGGSPP